MRAVNGCLIDTTPPKRGLGRGIIVSASLCSRLLSPRINAHESPQRFERYQVPPGIGRHCLLTDSSRRHAAPSVAGGDFVSHPALMVATVRIMESRERPCLPPEQDC